MLEILDAIARGIGYVSLAATAVILVGAVVMNLRPAPKKPTPPAEPVIGYWDDAAIEHPHPKHHTTLFVDTTTDDEAWAAISRRAS